MQASVSPSDTASPPISMGIVHLPLAKLRPRADARPIDKKAIASLAASVRELGFINPLRVRPAQITEGEHLVDGWEIITGRHRSIVAGELSIDLVPCVIVSDDNLRAELAMIDENLCRAELTAAQLSSQAARRKEIYETLHPETKQHVAGAHAANRAMGNASANLAPAFTKATAEATGLSERSIQRAVERGEALGKDADRITGTSLDKGVELDALAKMTPEERKPIIDRAAAGEKVTARPTTAVAAVKAEPAPEAQGPTVQPVWSEDMAAKAALVDRLREILRAIVADANEHLVQTAPLDAFAALLDIQNNYVDWKLKEDFISVLMATAGLPADPWPGLTRSDVNGMLKGRWREVSNKILRDAEDHIVVSIEEKILLAMRREWIENGNGRATAKLVPAATPDIEATDSIPQPIETGDTATGIPSQVATVSERGHQEAVATDNLSTAFEPEPATPAPLSVVPTAVVTDSLPEVIRPADKLTHLIAARNAPKAYPGAGEGWKQRHGRRH